MSLLKNNIQLFVLLSIFAFLFFWQKFAWVSLFLIPIFLAFFLEFFYFLRLRKNIIKEATMIKDSLIYRVSAGDFYIYSLSFFMALFALASLFLNLISFEKQDGFFLFVLLPLFLFFFKQKLQLQFLDNAYNDFRIIILSSLILALLYAIFNGVVNPIQSFNLEDFNQSIIYYKNSKFFIFDLISQILTLINALKEYFLYSLGLFWFRVLNFIFDFINFFIFCSFVAYLYNFEWVDNDSRAVEYEVRRYGGDQNAIFKGVKEKRLKDIKALPGVEYSYEVIAIDSVGLRSEPSKKVKAKQ